MRPRRLREEDRESLAALFRASGWSSEAEALAAGRDGIRGANDVLVRWIAEDVGYAKLDWKAHDEAGRFRVEMLVRPDARGRGVGGALWQALLEEAEARGATRLRAKVRDDDPSSLGFAERRGFRKVSHMFESFLDLETFDAAPFAVPEGVRTFSMADVPDDETHRRKLWRLNDYDIDHGGLRPFERFQSDVFEGYWYRPEGQIVAAVGDEWVGLAAVGMTGEGKGYNMMTGVVPAFRRRGIATALKLATIAWARRQGAREIWTHNDSGNAAMLSINRKLGYQAVPGWFWIEHESVHKVAAQTPLPSGGEGFG